MTVFWCGMSLLCLFHKPQAYSQSERRSLTQFPDLSVSSLACGTFMEEFDTYSADQFPFRDSFRSLKAASVLYLFGQSDYNGIYLTDGFLSETEYPLSQKMLKNAADRFQYLYDRYLKDTDTRIYLSIVPDKNYFLAEQSGHLSLDYPLLVSTLQQAAPYMDYLSVFSCLSADDYYRTDTHWKQENLLPVADTLLSGMNDTSVTNAKKSAASAICLSDIAPHERGYVTHTLPVPFYGVYYGHSALRLPPDTLTYLTSDTLRDCIVTSYSSGKPVNKELYDFQKAYGRDAYEIFLSGSEAFLTIENPNADTDRELVIFRDSFGSSLAPLLAEAYSKITLIDIRYMASASVGNFITFTDQDVLFLYSTILLNNSGALR